MLYVVCYDIADDSLRNKVASVLEGFGMRVQKSVFECELSEPGLRKMVKKLESIFHGEGEDSIRIYPLCQTCKANAMGIGHLGKNVLDTAHIFL